MAQKSYLQMQDELKKLTVKLEDDELDVDEAIAIYESATLLIKTMQKYLKTAENKLKTIRI